MHFAVQNLHSFGPYFTFCTLLGIISMQPCTLENSSETSLWAISVLLSEKFFILLFCAQFYSNQQQFIQILFTFLTALHKLYVLCSFKFVNLSSFSNEDILQWKAWMRAEMSILETQHRTRQRTVSGDFWHS